MMFGVVPRSDGPLARKLSGPEPVAYLGFGLQTRRVRMLAFIDRWRQSRAIFEEAKRARCFHLLRSALASIGIKGPRITAAKILSDVAVKYGFSVDEMKGRQRFRRLSAARQEAAYRIISESTLTYPQAGALMNRDHTTILTGAAAHAKRNKLPHARSWRAA